MSFDPQIDKVMQYANNFFVSAYPVAAIFMGVAIGTFIIASLVGIFRRRSDN